MSTETTANDKTATMPKTPWIALFKPGTHKAVITSAAMKRNHNDKLHLALECDTGNRVINHEMFVSTPEAAANTAKQIKRAFGVESFKDIGNIVGQKCVLRVEHEEYNGRVQAKVRYVNPDNSTDVDVSELGDLDAAFAEADKPAASASNVPF